MNFIVIYALTAILSLTIYLVSNKYLTLKDFNDSINFLKHYQEVSIQNNQSSEISTSDSIVATTGVVLNKSLKNLEFIEKLQAYIDCNSDSILGTDYLNEFEENKFKTQLLILNSTLILNTEYTRKAA